MASGPDYWSSRFGLGTEADFETACEEFLPHYPGILGSLARTGQHALLEAAYASPWGALGSYLALRLSQEGLGVPTTTATAVASQQPFGDPNNPEFSMSTLVIPGCFQVTIGMSAGGRAIENVIGVYNPSGTAAGAATTVKGAWEDVSGPAGNLSSLVAFEYYRAVDIGSLTGAIHVEPSTGHGNVASSNSLATRAASALVQWNGSSRSRSTRGRLYFGPLMDIQVDTDGASLVSTFQSDLVDSMGLFTSELQTDQYPLCVLSRKNSAYTLVNGLSVEPTIATQRRRIRS